MLSELVTQPLLSIVSLIWLPFSFPLKAQFIVSGESLGMSHVSEKVKIFPRKRFLLSSTVHKYSECVYPGSRFLFPSTQIMSTCLCQLITYCYKRGHLIWTGVSYLLFSSPHGCTMGQLCQLRLSWYLQVSPLLWFSFLNFKMKVGQRWWYTGMTIEEQVCGKEALS